MCVCVSIRARHRATNPPSEPFFASNFFHQRFVQDYFRFQVLYFNVVFCVFLLVVAEEPWGFQGGSAADAKKQCFGQR